MKKNRENNITDNLKGGLVGVIADKMTGNKGFTLIEVLAAMAILSIGLVSLMSLSVTSLKSKETGKRRTMAVNLAAGKLEALKAIPYTSIQVSSENLIEAIDRDCDVGTAAFTFFECDPFQGTSPVETFGTESLKFTWSWDVRFIDLDNDGVTHILNSSKIEDDDVKLITVHVVWDDAFGEHKVSLKTLRYRLG